MKAAPVLQRRFTEERESGLQAAKERTGGAHGRIGTDRSKVDSRTTGPVHRHVGGTGHLDAEGGQEISRGCAPSHMTTAEIRGTELSHAVSPPSTTP